MRKVHHQRRDLVILLVLPVLLLIFVIFILPFILLFG